MREIRQDEPVEGAEINIHNVKVDCTGELVEDEDDFFGEDAEGKIPDQKPCCLKTTKNYREDFKGNIE